MSDAENDTTEGETTEEENEKVINTPSIDIESSMFSSTAITIDQALTNHYNHHKPEIRSRDPYSHSCCNKLKSVLEGVIRKSYVSSR